MKNIGLVNQLILLKTHIFSSNHGLLFKFECILIFKFDLITNKSLISQSIKLIDTEHFIIYFHIINNFFLLLFICLFSFSLSLLHNAIIVRLLITSIFINFHLFRLNYNIIISLFFWRNNCFYWWYLQIFCFLIEIISNNWLRIKWL
jgi:hypothetical protein